MSEASQSDLDRNPGRTQPGRRHVLWLVGSFFVVVVVVLGIGIARQPPAPIQLALGDGRILQIEGVTYGVQHQMGKDSMLKRFRPWLPNWLVRRLSLDRRANQITLDRPGLVVWVNALNETSRTNVDCQGVRMEFVDRHGDLFGESTRSWFGGQDFWRVGHVFYCYPREEPELKLLVSAWKKDKTSEARLVNPRPSQPAEWSGQSLPLSKRFPPFEIRLSNLSVRTNGQGKKSYYETAACYFEPDWQVIEDGQPASGWGEPEWFAESANGNRGQFLGVHHTTLRFVATVYPAATNRNAAMLIATLPETDLSALTTNLWWNMTNTFASNAVVVLGLFSPGTHTFSEGIYQSSSITVSGPRGGAASGWTGSSRQVTPLKQVVSRNHYTPTPVIYLRVPPLALDPFEGASDSSDPRAKRLAIRLRDEHGNYWIAKVDNEVNGIQPFRLELPAGVTRIVAEVVLLTPLRAEFLVNTKNLTSL